VLLATSPAHLRSVTQDIVNGLDNVLFNDLMQNVAWLFGIYDSDHDGYLTKDEILQVSEALLVRLQLPSASTSSASEKLKLSP
jgi:Ca2+-binding EF-hand superfamily protein